VKPLLFITPQVSVTPGVAATALDRLRVPYRVLRAWEEEDWPELKDISRLIPLGGEMNVDAHDDFPFLKSTIDYTRAAIEAEVPVLGICLGGQVVARALGAEVRPATAREVGFHPIHPTAAGRVDPVLGSFARLDHVFQFHEDSFALPEESTLLFTGNQVRNQAFRHRDRTYGVQFHFEVTEKIISDWCDETPRLEEDWGTTKAQLLDAAKEYLRFQERAAEECLRRFCTLAP
jgi:GMP synthase (glutamine-hydrolysing)